MKTIPKDTDSKTDVTFICPESQEELIESLARMEKEFDDGEFKYKSIIFDSGSYWMNVILLSAMEDQTYDAEIFKRRRQLVDSVRADEAVYGSLASHMNRICKALKHLSQKGIPVVMIAQGMESPKWNRELGVAPNFIGQKFNRDLKSHFDLIGLVQTRVDEDNNIVYPPSIKFGCSDGSFMAKYTGKPLKSTTGIMDFKKVLPNGKGRFVLIYSAEAGEGKSTSCLQSLPQPILDIYVEDRNPNTSLEALE
jgi:hypothetical protein|tara:strand:- start:179 stop:934 length:756 start_codon:yes stop_codon:yes gene_type:complete